MRRQNITRVTNTEDAKLAHDRGHATATDEDGATRQVPWAATVIRVDGGWIAFESDDEAIDFIAQE